MMGEEAESIVISGISGRLPESDNIDEFKENLLNGVDLITHDDRRWPMGVYDLPTGYGKIKNLAKFDANFFGIHSKLAQSMDPQIRILLEIIHETIIDAGFNPKELRGTNTGVFIGISNHDSLESSNRDTNNIDGYGLLGGSTSMCPNRISYAFDLKGPSFSIDSACSSSMLALEQAVAAIKTGQCDAAFVGGVHINIRPDVTLQFHKLNMLSPESKSKVFDADCSGYVKSEAIVTVFLQKASDARRAYATILGVKTNNDGYKAEGITYPSGQMQNKLIREVYAESGVDPLDVVYLEAHGTGTKVGDPEEVNSITNIFCENRKGPLMIGSTKSNIGHPEPASGLASIAKVLIAMECGIIPANLNYNSPNTNIPALLDGRIKVVTENQKWDGGIVGINSFGIGGSNCHLILSSNSKQKRAMPPAKIARLITVSGRTEEAVEYFLEKIQEKSYDEELYSLLDKIHKINITGHSYRGYRIIGEIGCRETGKVICKKPPIWFVFTGMGCQWPRMGKTLMDLDPFNKSIQRSADTLRPYGIDLIDIIVNGDKTTFENILYSAVGIISIQIALVDVLRLLNIEPDGIIGHSIGEIGCAYADRTISSKQAMLIAYARGTAILEGKLPKGAMAAIGLTWSECERRVPPDVYLACHNSADNVTISGPPESIQRFTAELIKDGIFAKVINNIGFGFHSKYVANSAPILLKALNDILVEPKPRSSKWISSSIPESYWNTPLAKTNSAAYNVNNFLSPVYFYEASRHIPDNAIVLEIGPHALLQAILKRSLGEGVTIIGLLKKDHPDNVKYLLSNIGKLYKCGGQPDIAALYPAVSYPVSRATPMLGSMIQWDHTMEWKVPNFYGMVFQKFVAEINLNEGEFQYLSGHVIDGRILFPATGYLVLVWKSFAKLRNQDLEKLPIVIKDVHFLRPTIIPKEGSVKFFINILEGTGDFEIREGESVVVTGKIYVPDNIEKEFLDLTPQYHKDGLSLNKADIYKELGLRGYNYKGSFRGISDSDNCGFSGKLEWKNWVTFFDTMLQFCILGRNTRDLYLPRRLQKVVINPKAHIELDLNEIPVYMYRNINVIKSGAVELRGLVTSLAPRRQQSQAVPKLEKYQLIPLDNNNKCSIDDALAVVSQLVFENSSGAVKLEIVEIVNDTHPGLSVLPKILEIMEAEPKLYVEANIITSKTIDVATLKGKSIKIVSKFEKKTHLVILVNTLLHESFDIIEQAITLLKPGGFILFEEPSNQSQSISRYSLEVVYRQVTKQKLFILARKPVEIFDDSIVVNITEKNYRWIDPLKEALRISENRGCKIYVVCQGESLTGLIGMMNCIRKEPGGINTRCIFIPDKTAEPFSITTNCYKNQLCKDLVQNVLNNGIWGTFRYLLLEHNNLQVEHAYINTLTRGDLSSLTWIEGPLRFYKGDAKKLCTVYYSPLNFKDVLLATGKLTPDARSGDLAGQDCVLGLEFSGRDSEGKRVMGMVDARAMATTVLSDPGFLWDVPEDWSLEEAATVPVVYGTSYYALIVRGRIQAGETILIHAGSGGVGQASISIALHMGCKVFTTVGSQAKSDFLKKRFPELKDDCIGNSRDTSFEQMVLTQTYGRGVDFVLNSLAGEQLQASVRCLAVGGKFLEIGKVDISNNSALGLSLFLKNTTFYGIMLDALFLTDHNDRREVHRLINEGIVTGAVRPLPNTIFAEDQAEQAFRFMASGKHIGKVSLKIREEESRKTIIPSRKTITAVPKIFMNPDKVYIVIGGLGGFGLELVNWLIKRGAKKIIISSRNGVKTGYQSLCMRRWKNQNVAIHIKTDDVTTAEGAEMLLKESSTLGLVGAIFNLALVLRDALMVNQSEENFKIVCKSKIDATKHLDNATRKLSLFLDYFVIFSSNSSGRGTAGQANYGFANSAMERICEDRQAAGLPALAILWGVVGDVGFVAETMSGVTEIEGTSLQSISSCLSTLDILLLANTPVVSSIVVADKWKTINDTNNITLIDAVANILGIKDHKLMADDSTLADQGLDSIMGSEIKQTLERNYDLVLSPKELRDLTFNQLKEFGNKSTESQSFYILGQSCACLDGDLMPKDACVKMVSKETVNKNRVFIIHPIEGTVEDLKDLASNIKAPVYGLQCTVSVPLTSIADMAKYYIKEIKKVQVNGPYRLIAYSFGTCVGLEIGIQLEANMEKVQLLLIDGSHKYVVKLIGMAKETIARMGVVSEEIAMAIYFLRWFKEIDIQKINAEFLPMKCWDERVKRVVEIVGAISAHPPDQISTAFNSFCKKVIAVNSYKPSAMFNGDVVLLKARGNYLNLEEDYGLISICKQKVSIEVLEGTHRTILNNPRVFALANALFQHD